MDQPRQADMRNRLLRALSDDDFARLRPHLRRRSVPIREMMIAADQPILELFFPETGFVSITTSASTRQIELGLIGREGLVGAAPVLLGYDRTPFDHFVQSPGEVFGIGANELGAVCRESASLTRLLLRFVQTLLIQTAQTAFVNASYDIEARLARWLLMCQDRMDGVELTITHDFLAVMLGVQRTSVTLALQSLEGRGLIRARRGRIEVRDRSGLIDAADRGYGLPEAEYARLIEGPDIAAVPPPMP